MLKKILSSKECASCKFCCSFRRQSLWETPVFSKDVKTELEKLFPDARFKPAGTTSDESQKSDPSLSIDRSLTNSTNQFFTIDLLPFYKTDDPEEEVRCPFLKDGKGCQLSDELKPFDCKIWPIRIVKAEDGTLSLALTPTCRAINKLDFENVKRFVNEELKEKILEFAEKNPQIIKPASQMESRFENLKSL